MSSPSELPFDLAAAVAHLSNRDPSIARLIEEVVPFNPEIDHSQSPYQALLEAIAYQSISGKAAATIYARVKAIIAACCPTTPKEILKIKKPALRKAGMS